MFVKVGLSDFSNACFEFADESPEEAPHGSLENFLNILASHLHGLSVAAVVGFCA